MHLLYLLLLKYKLPSCCFLSTYYWQYKNLATLAYILYNVIIIVCRIILSLLLPWTLAELSRFLWISLVWEVFLKLAFCVCFMTQKYKIKFLFNRCQKGYNYYGSTFKRFHGLPSYTYFIIYYLNFIIFPTLWLLS